jgi:hypothetical protein
MRTQFNDSITRHNLNLHARLVQVVLPPEVGGQGEIAPVVDGQEPVAHRSTFTKNSELPQCRNSTIVQQAQAAASIPIRPPPGSTVTGLLRERFDAEGRNRTGDTMIP